ncbi:hypothetical protein [Cytobacillus gottheilii]|uniref:hypothetical protein n=1 Tax=Cytobacillus gottheilii TaxID=859144 RepID=UPI0009BB083D|nr:hypothetical protein [Cytobacillus gottheilii]
MVDREYADLEKELIERTKLDTDYIRRTLLLIIKHAQSQGYEDLLKVYSTFYSLASEQEKKEFAEKIAGKYNLGLFIAFMETFHEGMLGTIWKSNKA